MVPASPPQPHLSAGTSASPRDSQTCSRPKPWPGSVPTAGKARAGPPQRHLGPSSLWVHERWTVLWSKTWVFTRLLTSQHL